MVEGVNTHVTPMELSQRRLLEALRASPAVLFEQDLELRYTSVVNAQPPFTEAYVVGRTDFDLFSQEKAEEVTRVKRRVIETGEGARPIMSAVVGGEVREHALTIEPNRDADGNIIGVICLAWDVTRERAVERALANSQLQLCSLVSEAPTSIAMLDRDLRYVAVSRAWMKDFSRGHTNLVGRPHYEVWPESQLVWKEVHQAALAGEYLHKEEEIWVRPDGTKLWTRWAVYPWRDLEGHVAGIVLSIDDISERKRAEEALKESEERFRMMAETVPDGLFITRADGYSEYTNEQYFKTTGQLPNATRGNGWVDGVHPDDRDRILRSWMTAVETGEPYEERLRLVNLQTGTVRWHICRARPMWGEDGRIVRWFGCTVDIEDQVYVAALRETDRRKNEFLAMLSHELRNPLAAIRSAVYLLQNTPADGNAAARAKAVIDRQATHLTRVVDDLLDIARAARGKLHIEARKLDLGEIVRRTVDDYRAEFDKRQLEIDCWIGSNQVWVEGDETRLVQVIANLLGNAAKFTPAGGRVEVFLKIDQDTALLRVRDSGIGIPPERLADLFEPFVQIESTFDRGRGGLGLGLALIKRIIEMHHGNVTVTSAGRGQGTEFTIKLPLVNREVSASVPRKTGAMRQRRILIIEDNADMAELLRQLLVLLGQEVHVAGDGVEGIELARNVRPDLVICDIGLPELSGLDVALTMRADELFRATELVALSGYGLMEDRKKSAAAGFSKHLVKPVSMEDIEQLLADDDVVRDDS